MKKLFSICVILILLLSLFTMESCSSNSESSSSNNDDTQQQAESDNPEKESDNEDDDPNQCLITFETDGGTEIPVQKIAIGFKVFKPLDPVKTGYTFEGWFLDKGFTTPFDFDKEVSTNITIYAKWKINVYTVTFTNIYSGHPADYTVEKSVEYNSTATPLETPTRTGYTFVCWFSKESDPFDFSKPITEDTVITARWKINKYTVTFDSRGGSDVSSQEVEYGSWPDYSKAIPTKAYSDFLGWENSNGAKYYPKQYSNGYAIYSDITLYAIWKPYSENAISITVLPQSDIKITQVREGNVLTFTISTDYTVLGWYFENQNESTENSFSLNTATLQQGTYILELEASKDGRYYSYTAQIKID